METPTLQTKSHWLDGNPIQFDKVGPLNKLVAIALQGTGLPEDDSQSTGDSQRLSCVEQQACRPEMIQGHASECIEELLRSMNLNPVSGSNNSDVKPSEVRGNSTLRCMRDSTASLKKASSALRDAYDLLGKIEEKANGTVSRVEILLLRDAISRTAGWMYFSGEYCGELKPRVIWDKRFGSILKPRGIKRARTGFEQTEDAWVKWKSMAKGHKNPTVEELLSIMHKSGTAHWDHANLQVYFNKGPSGEWVSPVKESWFRNSLTHWKKQFRGTVPLN